MRNTFGPTLCRSIHYCYDCREAFEQFKPLWYVRNLTAAKKRDICVEHFYTLARIRESEAQQW
jgi:hypothetical protein